MDGSEERRGGRGGDKVDKGREELLKMKSKGGGR